MALDPTSYRHAAYPPPLRPPDLRDEDVAYLLDQQDKRSKAARKGAASKRKRATEQQKAEAAQ